MSASKSAPASSRITGAQLLAQVVAPNKPTGERTARLVNAVSVRTAKLGAAVAASTDNFGAHYDLERATLKVLADANLKAEAERAAARLNAALGR